MLVIYIKITYSVGCKWRNRIYVYDAQSCLTGGRGETHGQEKQLCAKEMRISFYKGSVPLLPGCWLTD